MHSQKGSPRESKSSHPWVNNRVFELVIQKQAAAGTKEEQLVCQTCSAGIKEEFDKYVQKVKERLQNEPRAAKGWCWWSTTRCLLRHSAKASSIPALTNPKGDWCMDAKSEADLLAQTFADKYRLPEVEINCYTGLERGTSGRKHLLSQITEAMAEAVLNQFHNDSATGPDQLPTRILWECAKELAVPLCMLAKAILTQGRWPELLQEHLIVPLYKKGSIHAAGNNPGVHLTAQLFKAN